MSHDAWWRPTLAASALLSVGSPALGQVPGDAQRAGRATSSIPHAAEDHVHDIEDGVSPTAEEARGSSGRSRDGVTLGPIPAGMPVNRLANFPPFAEARDPGIVAAHYLCVARRPLRVTLDPLRLPPDAFGEEPPQHFASLAPWLLQLNNCPDFVAGGVDLGTATQPDRPAVSEADKCASGALLWASQAVSLDAPASEARRGILVDPAAGGDRQRLKGSHVGSGIVLASTMPPRDASVSPALPRDGRATIGAT